MTQTLTLIMPDDFHLHLRDGEVLHSVVPLSARQMARALIMPNLKPPICTVKQALAYRERIQAAVPHNYTFEPLMSLYLTDQTTPEMVCQAKDAGIVAFKLYPAGATTNSQNGVTDIFRLLPVLHEMAAQGILLLVHGEVTDTSVDIFDREAIFLEKILKPILNQVPNLKVVLEHITTADAARFVCTNGENIAATVTPQHLRYNRNHVLVGGIHPHFYCLPILKRESHRKALLAAVTGEFSHKFFLGTDSAPHAQSAKENACGCAGVFSALTAIEWYAQIFEEAGALDKLQAFSSRNGAQFYGLPENTRHITLIKQPQRIPDSVPFGCERVIPMGAGETLTWTLAPSEFEK